VDFVAGYHHLPMAGATGMMLGVTIPKWSLGELESLVIYPDE